MVEIYFTIETLISLPSMFSIFDPEEIFDKTQKAVKQFTGWQCFFGSWSVLQNCSGRLWSLPASYSFNSECPARLQSWGAGTRNHSLSPAAVCVEGRAGAHLGCLRQGFPLLGEEPGRRAVDGAAGDVLAVGRGQRRTPLSTCRRVPSGTSVHLIFESHTCPQAHGSGINGMTLGDQIRAESWNTPSCPGTWCWAAELRVGRRSVTRVYCAGQNLARPQWLAAENTLALLVSGCFAFVSLWNQYSHR